MYLSLMLLVHDGHDFGHIGCAYPDSPVASGRQSRSPQACVWSVKLLSS